MKKLLFSLVIIILIAGCNFNQGIETDFTKKITIRNKGLTYNDFYFTVDGTKIDNNEVKMGSFVKLNISGVKGFKTINDKIKFGASLQLIAPDNTILFNNDDLLSDGKEYNKEDGDILYVQIKIDSPMEIGKEYKINSKFWDKNQENYEIKAEATIKVVE